ncbi:hypothetical protein K437DRAFT_230422 [Tilletiaria anomala UBC 951]|uniref:CID domain-containing protein n=1 Tax=Tilletiaria anomala (strain ATCC 24038 / CBS 436.72 / UBC 951) TaxID=1037660 RepID=A0A066WLW6_TILAU|nr:uncharacterized protein K437DRAFT_230422 [Tilletiaria anomala UBC 951]KDN53588.1 hypothetical protein K437DRAFT_230422 [Tilletiaria anomala UBC 951]
MDAFAIRLAFIAQLRKLNASQQSINKVLALAVRHAATSSDDIWSCIMQECRKASLNARVNIFFLLDALFTDESFSDLALANTYYLPYARKDLKSVVDMVVPKEALTMSDGTVVNREGAGIRLNAGNVLPILAGWKIRQVFPTELLESMEQELRERKQKLRTQGPLPDETSKPEGFSRNDVLRRIEEDRERHKRLRERGWILPPKVFSVPNAQSLHASRARAAKGADDAPVSASWTPASPRDSSIASTPRTPCAAVSTSIATTTTSVVGPVQQLDPISIEFDQVWETASDLNADDLDKLTDEHRLWWGSEANAEAFLQQQEEMDRERLREWEEQQAQLAKEAEAAEEQQRAAAWGTHRAPARNRERERERERGGRERDHDIARHGGRQGREAMSGAACDARSRFDHRDRAVQDHRDHKRTRSALDDERHRDQDRDQDRSRDRQGARHQVTDGDVVIGSSSSGSSRRESFDRRDAQHRLHTPSPPPPPTTGSRTYSRYDESSARDPLRTWSSRATPSRQHPSSSSSRPLSSSSRAPAGPGAGPGLPPSPPRRPLQVAPEMSSRASAHGHRSERDAGRDYGEHESGRTRGRQHEPGRDTWRHDRARDYRERDQQRERDRTLPKREADGGGDRERDERDYYYERRDRHEREDVRPRRA